MYCSIFYTQKPDTLSLLWLHYYQSLHLYVLNHFLDNDPGKAISFGGVLLLIASLATMLIKTVKHTDDDLVMPIGGGH